MNPAYIIVTLLLAELFWLSTLGQHLTNDKLDPTDKICWTVVLCTLNLLGVAIFFAVGPNVSKARAIK
jgi:hypothetical protein